MYMGLLDSKITNLRQSLQNQNIINNITDTPTMAHGSDLPDPHNRYILTLRNRISQKARITTSYTFYKCIIIFLHEISIWSPTNQQ